MDSVLKGLAKKAIDDTKTVANNVVEEALNPNKEGQDEKVVSDIIDAASTSVDVKNELPSSNTPALQQGGKLKKAAALLKKAAKKLPSLSDIKGGALKQKVKSAKKKLLKASDKADKASRKMKKGGSKKASKKASKKSSSRKSSKKSSRK